MSLAGRRASQPGQVMGEERKGRKFCFATDTVAAPGLAEFVRGADLFICEGMFAEELAETAAEKKHLTAAQAARIARDGSVKELGLIHYSPRYSERELKKLLQRRGRSSRRPSSPGTSSTSRCRSRDLGTGRFTALHARLRRGCPQHCCIARAASPRLPRRWVWTPPPRGHYSGR